MWAVLVRSVAIRGERGSYNKLDATSGTFKATMRADEIPEQLSQAEAASMLSSATEARKKLKELALEMKSKSGGRAPKKEAP